MQSKQNTPYPCLQMRLAFCLWGGFLRYHVGIGVLLDKSHNQHHTVLSLPVVPPSIRHAAVAELTPFQNVLFVRAADYHVSSSSLTSAEPSLVALAATASSCSEGWAGASGAAFTSAVACACSASWDSVGVSSAVVLAVTVSGSTGSETLRSATSAVTSEMAASWLAGASATSGSA